MVVENIKTEEDLRKLYQEQAEKKSKQIWTALQDGDEKKASYMIKFECGNWEHEQQRMLLSHADCFKDPEILYDLFVEVYINDGYHFPKELIQKAKRISKQVPEDRRLKDLPSGDPVTVWRGVSESASRTDISWTTDRKQAIWFANRYRIDGKGGAVWEATIPRNKIIAYTNCRCEREVIQYMNVQNIHLLEISEDEWAKALMECDEERKIINEI